MDKNSVGRRAGEQGLRPSVGNQAEVKKSITGTNYFPSCT